MARGSALTQKQLLVMREAFMKYPNYTNKRIAQKLKTSDSTISRYRDKFNSGVFPKLEDEVITEQVQETPKQSTLFDNVPDVHIARGNVGAAAISAMFDYELSMLDGDKKYDITITIKRSANADA